MAATDDLALVGAVDRARVGEDAGRVAGLEPNGLVIASSLIDALGEASPEVAVDFTLPSAVMGNVRTALRAGVACVVGATGLTDENLAEIAALSEERKRPVFIAPNFAMGAVLMMQFAAQAARHLGSAEIVELHHEDKADAPSGTALRTARLMTAVSGSKFAKAESGDGRPSRGLTQGPVHIHSVRLPGLVAHQEVIFGGLGETLTIRHDSTSHQSFMPGVLLAIRKVLGLRGVVVGLENIM
jgi:4-hydroxy-tetrahydrodipicolinate reductase